MVYVGAEFCPYCAAERWALVVALGRFGSFSHLGATSSSTAEVFPGTPTFIVRRDHLPEPLRVSSPASRNTVTGPRPRHRPAFPACTCPRPLEWALVRRYDTGPFVPGHGTLPFIDVDNRLVVSGSGIGFSPGVFQGQSMAQVAGDLSDPTKQTPRRCWGRPTRSAAAICAAPAAKPASVCTSPGVRAGASRLGICTDRRRVTGCPAVSRRGAAGPACARSRSAHPRCRGAHGS